MTGSDAAMNISVFASVTSIFIKTMENIPHLCLCIIIPDWQFMTFDSCFLDMDFILLELQSN